MANEFIIKKGLISKANSVVSGSLIVTDGVSGSFSGSFEGDGSGLTGLISSSFSTTASYALTSISSSYSPSIPPFPFTGEASITGSLTISGSFITSRNSDLSNTVIGSASAAAMNSGATGNVIIGNEAANSLTSGDDNVIIGENAAKTVTSGYDNVYIGHSSGLQAHTTNAIGNVVIGVDAGLGSGGALSSRNVFVGQAAGYNVDGRNNVYVGREAGRGEAGADGTSNSGFGAFALTDNRDGNYNIGIGYYAGGAIKDGSNNIFIGSGSLGELNTESQLRIGHADLITISASLTTGEILLNTTTISGSLLNTGTVSIDDTDSPYTITGTQQFILIDPSNGDVTVNMPDASTYPGRQIFFKITQAAGANTVTLQRQGGDTIDGATTYEDLDIQYESISTVSDGGTGWFIF